MLFRSNISFIEVFLIIYPQYINNNTLFLHIRNKVSQHNSILFRNHPIAILYPIRERLFSIQFLTCKNDKLIISTGFFRAIYRINQFCIVPFRIIYNTCRRMSRSIRTTQHRDSYPIHPI